MLARVGHGPDDVWRVPAAGDRDEEVARLDQVHELLRENVLVANVVRERGDDRRVVVQAQDAKAAHVRPDRVFAEICRHVARRRGATAVADGEDLLLVPIRAKEHLAHLSQAIAWERVDGGSQLLEISGYL